MISQRIARLGARALTLAVAAGSLAACATVTRGSSQDFVVESTPPGAAVATSNGFQCDATPCTFRMPRRPGFDVTVSMDGYVTQTVTVDSSMSSGGGVALAGNVLIGGVVGAGVDAASGALNDLTPNPLHVTLLTPAQHAEAERAASAAAGAGGDD
ncbi:translation initiation factor 2 [Brevundimonas sp.]|uniref:translation initiation factor 2 n=1 Tax=Brevundimonas sp. TaxID=1871086 RepID=UPI0025E9E435|nr:translation initiation factor 2 [Brevundimonas sp.]